MASPRPTSCAPRSQAMSPWRGSDPDSRDSRSSSPWARASSARIRSSQISRITRPSSAGAAANRSIAASASARHPRHRAPAASPPKSRSPQCNTRVSCMEQIVYRGAHLGYSTVAVAAPGPLPRGVHVHGRKQELVEPPLQAHVADLPQHRQSALTLRRGLPMHQRHTQRHTGHSPARNPHSIAR